MSQFQRCTCLRLNLRGQRCICTTTGERPCDCTYDGNRQIVGPECSEHIRDAWRMAVTGVA